MANFREKLESQAWFQELLAKWHETDPKVRKNVTLGATLGGVLTLILLSFSFYWSVKSIEKEYQQKNAIIQMLQTSAEELRSLRASRNSGAEMQSGGWSSYFTDLAQMNRIDPEKLTVGAEKKLPPQGAIIEQVLEIELKKVTLSQVTDFSFSVEHGSRPVKIRNLELDTEMNPEGYLSAKISVSTYEMESDRS